MANQKSLYIKDEDYQIIQKASEVERRSSNSVIVKGALDYAKKILRENDAREIRTSQAN